MTRCCTSAVANATPASSGGKSCSQRETAAAPDVGKNSKTRNVDALRLIVAGPQTFLCQRPFPLKNSRRASAVANAIPVSPSGFSRCQRKTEAPSSPIRNSSIRGPGMSTMMKTAPLSPNTILERIRDMAYQTMQEREDIPNDYPPYGSPPTGGYPRHIRKLPTTSCKPRPAKCPPGSRGKSTGRHPT